MLAYENCRDSPGCDLQMTFEPKGHLKLLTFLVFSGKLFRNGRHPCRGSQNTARLSNRVMKYSRNTTLGVTSCCSTTVYSTGCRRISSVNQMTKFSSLEAPAPDPLHRSDQMWSKWRFFAHDGRKTKTIQMKFGTEVYITGLLSHAEFGE